MADRTAATEPVEAITPAVAPLVLVPALAWPRVGGHAGIALPIVNFGGDGVTAIGADFVQVGIAPGVTIKLNSRWAVDLEFIGFSRWQRAVGATPASVRTIVVIDPGVVYNAGPLAIGLRLAMQLGERVPFNLGLVPIFNKGFSLGPVGFFVELDLPFFVFVDTAGTTATFTPLLQIGFGF